MTDEVRITTRFLIIQACTLVLLASFVSLGVWQLERGDVKNQIESSVIDNDPDYSNVTMPLSDYSEWRYKRIKLQGSYLSAKQFLLDNQIRDGIAGYSVLTPFNVQGSNAVVLVDRGWIPQGYDRTVFPEISLVETAVTIPGSVYVLSL